jgi:hypothetical protein
LYQFKKTSKEISFFEKPPILNMKPNVPTWGHLEDVPIFDEINGVHGRQWGYAKDGVK